MVQKPSDQPSQSRFITAVLPHKAHGDLEERVPQSFPCICIFNYSDKIDGRSGRAAVERKVDWVTGDR